MSIFTHVNQDQTIFKTDDGRYINYRGCDISSRVNKLSKPQKYIQVSSQPKFYLITYKWNVELEEPIDVDGPYNSKGYAEGPYNSKEYAEGKCCKNQYIILANEETVSKLKLTLLKVN